jgi:sarcosine oxidase
MAAVPHSPPQAPSPSTGLHRIVIVGGGVMGCSTAYHLALAGRARDACVIEPDPTYEFAATPRAVGSVRRVHGLPENVRMSQFGSEFFGSFGERMAVDGDAPNISYRRQGYTFMVWGRENVAALEVAWRMQTSLGAPVRLVDRPALKALFPSLTVDDVDAAGELSGRCGGKSLSGTKIREV